MTRSGGGTAAGEQALRLAASGMTATEIAGQLGWTRSRAARAVAAAAKQAADESLERRAEREVELAHLSSLRRALLPAALRGDAAAARVLVRISAQRSTLLRLADAPVQDVPVGPDPTKAGEVTFIDTIRAARTARQATGPAAD